MGITVTLAVTLVLLFIGQASSQLATLALELRLNFLLEEEAGRNEVTRMQVTRI